ncbi:MAG: hypothetical protein ACRDZQ_13095 [Acidimicrobiales bacterium]
MARRLPEVEAFDDDAYEEQCQIGSFWSASRLLVAASLFLYGTFTFAYFYLRALNNHNDWRVGGQHPSMILGTLVALCIVGAAIVHYGSARRLQIGALFDWQSGAAVSLGLVATACGLQIWELTRLPFHPASSGYTSVFIAWMPIYIVYMLGQFYWLETLIAQSIVRPRSVMLRRLDEGPLIIPRFGANVESYILFSQFMAVGAILIWILFYVL